MCVVLLFSNECEWFSGQLTAKMYVNLLHSIAHKRIHKQNTKVEKHRSTQHKWKFVVGCCLCIWCAGLTGKCVQITDDDVFGSCVRVSLMFLFIFTLFLTLFFVSRYWFGDQLPHIQTDSYTFSFPVKSLVIFVFLFEWLNVWCCCYYFRFVTFDYVAILHKLPIHCFSIVKIKNRKTKEERRTKKKQYFIEFIYFVIVVVAVPYRCPSHTHTRKKHNISLRPVCNPYYRVLFWHCAFTVSAFFSYNSINIQYYIRLNKISV